MIFIPGIVNFWIKYSGYKIISKSPVIAKKIIPEKTNEKTTKY